MDIIGVQHAAAGLRVKVFDDETRLRAAPLVAFHLKKMATVANLHLQLFLNQAQMRVQLPDQLAEAGLVLRRKLERQNMLVTHNVRRCNAAGRAVLPPQSGGHAANSCKRR